MIRSQVLYELDTSKEDPAAKGLELDMAGHRSGVRAVAISTCRRPSNLLFLNRIYFIL